MKNNFTVILCFIIKLVLGITFVYASWHKIEDPAEFAKILYGYALFPGFVINILAIVIPFVELVAGFSLMMGLFPRSAVLILNGLLLGFILVIGFNLLRGHQFDCGCFSLASQTSTASNISYLIRDGLLLIAGIYFYKASATAS
ncbi:MAG: DoxX family membrane protein [Desulfobacteraceae bacterium]|nr:DoxX family membrane protein [Desulfobacteraceae bacterium]